MEGYLVKLTQEMGLPPISWVFFPTKKEFTKYCKTLQLKKNQQFTCDYQPL